MPDSTKLRVDIDGDDIIVALPQTSFKATYRRQRSRLERVGFARSDLTAPLSLREFIALADNAASDKARELGWLG